MDSAIIGISCGGHDSSVAIISQGQIIFAAQEERFSRIKGDGRFPRLALEYCFKHFDFTNSKAIHIVHAGKPYQKSLRILSQLPSSLTSPRALLKLVRSIIRISTGIEGREFKGRVIKIASYSGIKKDLIKFHYREHHICHAAGAALSSDFSSGAALVLDGIGDYYSSSLFYFDKSKHTLLKRISGDGIKNSMGILYAAFTNFLGFKVNSGEYKVMGLAAYGGDSDVTERIRKCINIVNTSSRLFHVKPGLFQTLPGKRAYTSNLEAIAGVNSRTQETPTFDAQHLNIAWSIQKILSESLKDLLKSMPKRFSAKGVYNVDKLVYSGGVALNCAANSCFNEFYEQKNIYIQPAAGDSGLALGAALLISHENRHEITVPQNYCFGSHIRQLPLEELEDYKDITIMSRDKNQTLNLAIESLMNNKIIAIARGSMEYGPRALGNRSIIADPRFNENRDRLNAAVKKRESFRPFAPIVLAEEFPSLFSGMASKHMLVNAQWKPDLSKYPDLDIPSAVHCDGSSRVQVLEKADNEFLYSLMKSFHELTGCPAIINTSFNVRGEPLVRSEADAIKCFLNSDIDYLILGDLFLEKNALYVSKKHELSFALD